MATITLADILATLPARFLPERAMDAELIIHFQLSSTPFTLSITQGTCSVLMGLHGNPSSVITCSEEMYISLETGAVSAQLALLSGKISVTNLLPMLQLTKLFRKFTAGLAVKSKEETKNISRTPLQGPLSGIRILDLSRLLPAPLATQMMAELGAEVIKIEDPHAPDPTRQYPPLLEGQSVYYLALNSGKKSICLDLYSDEGKEVFRKLILTADIVVESFRPGVMQKIGIDYDQMKAIKPSIIYVSVTGYGQSGEYASKAGHDINYIGYAGLLGLTGQAPTLSAAQIADVAGGSYLALSAVLLALRNRDRTGKGEHVDVSMSDGVLPLLSLTFAAFLNSGQYPPSGKGMLDGGAGNYNIYACKDGKYMALGALEPPFFEAFCHAAHHPEWVQLALPSPENQGILHTLLTEFFLQKTQAEWMAFAENKDFCLSPIYDLGQVVNDPHFQSREVFRTHTHPQYGSYQSIGFPLKFLENPLSNVWAAPLLGEDTQSVLGEL